MCFIINTNSNLLDILYFYLLTLATPLYLSCGNTSHSYFHPTCCRNHVAEKIQDPGKFARQEGVSTSGSPCHIMENLEPTWLLFLRNTQDLC